MNRRRFLKATGAAVAGAVLSGCNTKGSISSFSPISKPLGANSDIRVAVIGFNQQGKTHIKAFNNIPGVRLVALCDADAKVLGTQVDELSKQNIRVRPYRDLRDLLDNKDIDAVSCAMPFRWHALTTVWACQAGKDVYCEKPISHNIWEGRKSVEAARKYHRMVQVGLVYRSKAPLQRAIEYVHSGQLGKPIYARAWDYKRRESIGKVNGPQRIPESVDYNLWVGPGPMLPLMRQKLHYDWHWQWQTGAGEICNNGVHQFDQVRWALAKDHLPQPLLTIGGRYAYLDDGQTPNTFMALYDYDGIPLIYESRALPARSGAQSMDVVTIQTAAGNSVRLNPAPPTTKPAGIPVFSGNTIVCEAGYMHAGVIYDNDGKIIQDFSQEKSKPPQENFIAAVRSRKIADLKPDIEQGHLSTCICHLGNISQFTGETMSFAKARPLVAPHPHATAALDSMIQHLTANGVDVAKSTATVGPALTIDQKTERFTGPAADRANIFIKDSYRAPFIVPEHV